MMDHDTKLLSFCVFVFYAPHACDIWRICYLTYNFLLSGAQIGTAIYNCGLFCGIIIPIYFLIGATYPLLVMWLRAIATAFIATSSIVLLYSNRYMILQHATLD